MRKQAALDISESVPETADKRQQTDTGGCGRDHSETLSSVSLDLKKTSSYSSSDRNPQLTTVDGGLCWSDQWWTVGE